MSTPPLDPAIRFYRFSVFEVDLAAGELRKNGCIRLQEQPFQVLSALLQNAGQVVTRETLRQRIWPADTFVDFDHSLNTAVNKIRESLGDSASSPRFVETLARRGYRFIAPVERIDGHATPITKQDRDPGNERPANLDLSNNTERNNTAPNNTASSPDATKYNLSFAPATALHPDLHVPIPRRGLVRSLFALIQLMYLIFYLCALARLHAIDQVMNSFLTGWRALAVVAAVLVTGAIGIPLRCYLLSAVAFDFRKLAGTFSRLFPFILALDGLWAIAPFLLLPQIGIGLAFAAVAALLYVPFSERTLVLMAYQAQREPA